MDLSVRKEDTLAMAYDFKTYSRGGGRHCSVRGYTYNEKKLSEVCSRPCLDHYPQLKRDCPCDPPYRFYSPKDQNERREWLSQLQLKNPSKCLYVCSFHFVGKQPTEQNHLPQLFLGHERLLVKKPRRILVRSTAGQGVERGKRNASTAPECTIPEKRFQDEASTVSSNDDPGETETCADLPPPARSNGDDAPPCTEQLVNAQTQWVDPVFSEHSYAAVLDINTMHGVSTQTPPAPTVSCTGIQCTITEDNSVASSLNQSDTDANLYTGILESRFEVLVTCMTPFADPSYKIGIVDQILLTLMKLKLNLLLADIARRFSVSEALVSRIISFWINTLSVHLTNLVVWLPRETIRATMPPCFKANYPKTTVILHCAETFMQKATNLESRGESYSVYKSHNTAKYLVAIAPSGYIMFISSAYGG